MTTPKPDLALRLAVAKTMPEKYPNARINKLLGYVVYYVDGAVLGTPHFDLSFDAILPLVRELKDKDAGFVLKTYLFNQYGYDPDCILFEATPADYCRAYLSAVEKGEKE